MELVGQIDFCLREQIRQLLPLCFMIENLSWIHHECKIEARAKFWFLISPYLLDLPPYAVSLNGVAEVPDRYDNDPVHTSPIGCNQKPHPWAGEFLTFAEYRIDLWLLFYNFLFSKAFSHRRR